MFIEVPVGKKKYGETTIINTAQIITVNPWVTFWNQKPLGTKLLLPPQKAGGPIAMGHVILTTYPFQEFKKFILSQT